MKQTLIRISKRLLSILKKIFKAVFIRKKECCK
jgi:hypothetical protein